MKVISLCNQKGGVGKSTVAYHLAWGLYELNYAVLLIDIDPQGNLSCTFDRPESCSVLEVFSNNPRLITEVVISNDSNSGISLVSSNILKLSSKSLLRPIQSLKRPFTKILRDIIDGILF